MASFLALLLMLAAFVWVVAPLLRGPVVATASEVDVRRSDLIAQRDAQLDQAAEARLDHAMGKLPAEELAALESRVQGELVSILKQLDALGGNGAASSTMDRP